MMQARESLAAAKVLIASEVASRAVSDAYYAMLYAARAALSEEDLYAKTHKGTWDLFWQTFATSGRFDEGLASDARATQKDRENTDYNARPLDAEGAGRVVDLADRFVAAIEEMLD
jgi:uncharacterized protein (UPF0332 family)